MKHTRDFNTKAMWLGILILCFFRRFTRPMTPARNGLSSAAFAMLDSYYTYAVMVSQPLEIHDWTARHLVYWLEWIDMYLFRCRWVWFCQALQIVAYFYHNRDLKRDIERGRLIIRKN